MWEETTKRIWDEEEVVREKKKKKKKEKKRKEVTLTLKGKSKGVEEE